MDKPEYSKKQDDTERKTGAGGYRQRDDSTRKLGQQWRASVSNALSTATPSGCSAPPAKRRIGASGS
jgi:hypothetical protein